MNTITCQKKGRVLILDDQPDNIHTSGQAKRENRNTHQAVMDAREIGVPRK